MIWLWFVKLFTQINLLMIAFEYDGYSIWTFKFKY